jgi:hypothetical protein
MDLEGLRLIRLNSSVVFPNPKANFDFVSSFYLELFPPHVSEYHVQIFCPKAAFQTLLKFYHNAAVQTNISTKFSPNAVYSNSPTFHYLTFFAPKAELASCLPLPEGRARTAWENFKSF